MKYASSRVVATFSKLIREGSKMKLETFSKLIRKRCKTDEWGDRVTRVILSENG